MPLPFYLRVPSLKRLGFILLETTCVALLLVIDVLHVTHRTTNLVIVDRYIADIRRALCIKR